MDITSQRLHGRKRAWTRHEFSINSTQTSTKPSCTASSNDSPRFRPRKTCIKYMIARPPSPLRTAPEQTEKQGRERRKEGRASTVVWRILKVFPVVHGGGEIRHLLLQPPHAAALLPPETLALSVLVRCLSINITPLRGRPKKLFISFPGPDHKKYKASWQPLGRITTFGLNLFKKRKLWY